MFEKTECFVFVKNMGGHYETWETGVLGPVALYGLDQGKRDLSWVNWTYQVRLIFFNGWVTGEKRQL